MAQGEPPPNPEPERWHTPPGAGWFSDNTKAGQAILALCEGRRFYSSLVDAEASQILHASKGLVVPVGSVVVVLPEDGRTYVVAPDGCEGDFEQVRCLGKYSGDLSQLGVSSDS
jgi:hypothetical protein